MHHAWPGLSDLFLAAVLGVAPASAVQRPTTQSAGHGPAVGGYGGIGARVGPVGSMGGVFTVSRGGVVLGERLTVGGAFVSVAPRHGFGPPMRSTTGRVYTTAMLYFGLELGWVAYRRGRVEIGPQALLGVGLACIVRLRGRGDHDCVERLPLYVAEPSAFVRVDLTPARANSPGRRAMIRVEFDAGYRLVRHRPWPSGNDVRLAAPYLGANLDFGWFPTAARQRR